MPAYTQEHRQLRVNTPLGKDALLLVGLSGHEAISQLFSFHLDLLAEHRDKIKFETLLGGPVTITIVLPDGSERYFNGICNRVSQGAEEGHDDTFSPFTNYRMEVVPLFWLLTKRAQSRIFQQLSVPDILKKVLAGIPVSFELSGTFEPRDYCVQYRETDFNFASRLMEEEGIYYYFKHTDNEHKMVIANTPQSHDELPYLNSIIYETITGGLRPEDRISSWEKSQVISSGKYTLWDHCFELPHKHLDATALIQSSVQAGEISHLLTAANASQLEVYDYPGGYAQRFDGITPGGGEQASNLQKIFQDNTRTTKIRIQQEAVGGVTILGASNCRHFTTGYKFKLDRHFDGDGEYLLTAVNHSARESDYRSSEGEVSYENTFACIPLKLPFRPVRTAPRPAVLGTQTAVVVGPAGEEIFTDKYGRVKVQFHWDREGKADNNSSCWLRVAQNSAGKQWGSIFLPRIGHEVVVAFEEGDPDRPIIVGSVYNANEIPPYKLPDEKNKTVLFKSNSTKGGGGFNEIRIDDTKGKEQIFIHGERDRDIRIKHDQIEYIGNETHLIVVKDQLEKVSGDKHQEVVGDLNEKIGGTVSLKVDQDQLEKVNRRYALDVGQEIHLKAGMSVVIEAGTMITLKVGGNFVTINAAGVAIKGTMVNINSAGAAGSGSGAQPEAPKQPKEADKADPGKGSQAPPASQPPPAFRVTPGVLAMQQASKSGAPFCDI